MEYEGKFEVSGSPKLLAGYIGAEVREVGGVDPTTIIRFDQDWVVTMEWGLQGSLKSMICGEWCLNVDLESIGPGEEMELPTQELHVKLDPCGTGKYKKDIRIPAGTVKPEHCSTPYKLVATVTYLNACGRPGPMAGFVEGPIVQFYDPGEELP
jgi:hypothetical protein